MRGPAPTGSRDAPQLTMKEELHCDLGEQLREFLDLHLENIYNARSQTETEFSVDMFVSSRKQYDVVVGTGRDAGAFMLRMGTILSQRQEELVTEEQVQGPCGFGRLGRGPGAAGDGEQGAVGWGRSGAVREGIRGEGLLWKMCCEQLEGAVGEGRGWGKVGSAAESTCAQDIGMSTQQCDGWCS